MPRYCKKDGNHKEIVKGLEKVGAVCYDTSMVGNGFPDAMVYFRQRFYLMEFKVEKGKKTKKQVEFHERCERDKIKIHIVRTMNDALKAINF